MARVNLGRVVGRSAYEEAVRQGYEGTESEWLETLKGKSAYQIAVEHGYVGTEEEWLAAMKGEDAYDSAIKGGFVGTKTEFYESISSIGYLNHILDFVLDGGES